MTKSTNTAIQEIIFDAELWIYQRKSAFPMVACLPGPANGLWEKFNYHPVCNGNVLQDQDILVLGLDGAYTVRSKPCDQDKYIHLNDIIKAKFVPAYGDEVEIYGRVREFKGDMICCNEIHSESPFFCFENEAEKIDLPESVIKSLCEVV
ncbi:hypothetical protein [Acinetobacter sp. CFCC 10889]|uniref:hypothetical protein n=1 Tax=Acinetobacter sp. CFCC 10889 TaxID=1775557 RepID=UPI000DD0C2DE|nr:hypothetical protein [Acinetobacter sp. CFCC 10889]